MLPLGSTVITTASIQPQVLQYASLLLGSDTIPLLFTWHPRGRAVFKFLLIGTLGLRDAVENW